MQARPQERVSAGGFSQPRGRRAQRQTRSVSHEPSTQPHYNILYVGPLPRSIYPQVVDNRAMPRALARSSVCHLYLLW